VEDDDCETAAAATNDEESVRATARDSTRNFGAAAERAQLGRAAL